MKDTVEIIKHDEDDVTKVEVVTGGDRFWINIKDGHIDISSHKLLVVRPRASNHIIVTVED